MQLLRRDGSRRDRAPFLHVRGLRATAGASSTDRFATDFQDCACGPRHAPHTSARRGSRADPRKPSALKIFRGGRRPLPRGSAQALRCPESSPGRGPPIRSVRTRPIFAIPEEAHDLGRHHRTRNHRVCSRQGTAAPQRRGRHRPSVDLSVGRNIGSGRAQSVQHGNEAPPENRRATKRSGLHLPFMMLAATLHFRLSNALFV